MRRFGATASAGPNAVMCEELLWVRTTPSCEKFQILIYSGRVSARDTSTEEPMQPSTTRRGFVNAATVGVGAIALAAAPVANPLGAEAKQTPVVGTHVHCFAGRDDPRFP